MAPAVLGTCELSPKWRVVNELFLTVNRLADHGSVIAGTFFSRAAEEERSTAGAADDQVIRTTYFPQIRSASDFYCFPSSSMSTAIFEGSRIMQLGSFRYFFRRQMGKISCERQQFLSPWAAMYIHAKCESKCGESENAQRSRNELLEKQKVTLARAVPQPFDCEGRIWTSNSASPEWIHLEFCIADFKFTFSVVFAATLWSLWTI